MKTNYFLAALLLMAFPGSLCAQVSETRNLSPFSSLKVVGDFDITLVPGNEDKIEWTITGTESTKVVSETKNGELMLRFRSLFSGAAVKGTLYYKTLSHIETRTSAVVRSADTLILDSLSFTGGPDGLADLRIRCGKLSVSAIAGADLYFYGTAQQMYVKANSGGTIRLQNVEAENAAVESVLGSAVYVWVEGSLYAKAFSKGKIYHKGIPAELKTETGTGGEIISQ